MKSFSVLFLFLLAISAQAAGLPDCLDNKKMPLPVINAQVLNWKKSTKNLFTARAHITGTVIRLYPDRNNHNHFQIQMGKAADETLEVVYSQDFGALPPVRVGMNVEACGDYITSIAAAQYPASPDGAIIHWIHKNPSKKGHPSGYLAIDGVLYGQGRIKGR